MKDGNAVAADTSGLKKAIRKARRQQRRSLRLRYYTQVLRNWLGI